MRDHMNDAFQIKGGIPKQLKHIIWYVQQLMLAIMHERDSLINDRIPNLKFKILIT